MKTFFRNAQKTRQELVNRKIYKRIEKMEK